MAGFTKLFNSILHSTIWSEPDHVRILWITMLAMSNKHGEVESSIPGLARMAGKSIEETEDAIQRFLSPDSYSRTPDNEGRRIQTIVGGWLLLNHSKYRALLSAEERKEYNRKKQAERRAKLAQSVNDTSITVNDNQQCQHIPEADTDTEANTVIPKDNVPDGTDVTYCDFVESIWKLAPKKSRLRTSRKKVSDQWAATKAKPNTEKVLALYKKLADTQEWKKQDGQYAPSVHRWIKERRWETEFEETETGNHAGTTNMEITGEEF